MDDKQKSCDRCGEPAIAVNVTTNSDKKYTANLCPTCAQRERASGKWAEVVR